MARFKQQYSKGISVITPAYDGENHIHHVLNSFKQQTLSKSLFEIIFVVNGPLNKTFDIIVDFIKDNPEMNVKLVYTPIKGASNAYNMGLKFVQMEYTTFIDDDDFVSPTFLEKLYEHSKPYRVVLSNFIDVDEETREEMESPLVPFSMQKSGVVDDALESLQSIVAITAAKSVPSFAAQSVNFNTEIQSGQDIVYYCELYPKFDFEFYFIDKKEGATYYRVRRNDSVSRKSVSYEFNVTGKLYVINELNKILESLRIKKYKDFLELRIRAQSSFIRLYLKENPQDKEKVLKDVEKYNFTYFPMNIFE